ncbi:MAG: signal peptidase I [Oscillospiraceae bacterium]
MDNLNENVNNLQNQEDTTNIKEADKVEDLQQKEIQNKSKKIVNDICDMVESVLFSIFTVILIFTFLFKVASVIGTSMEPTLHGGNEIDNDGDKLIISSAFYNNPKQKDIVIIDAQNSYLLEDIDGDGQATDVVEGQGLGKTIVKRVIATAGQTVDIDFSTGNVSIDGEIIHEAYINNLTTNDEGAFQYPITIPEGYVFVLGDNRVVSKDSRSDEVGLIPVETIVGKVVLRISPMEKFGFVE